MKKRICALLLALLLLTGLVSACSTSSKEEVDHISGQYTITVDENGLATWDAVSGAVQYEYCIVDAEHTSLYPEFTTETSVQLPEGRCVHVRALSETGEQIGHWLVSEYYGEPTVWSFDDMETPPADHDDPADYIDLKYTLKWDDTSAFDLVSAIRYDTVSVLEDGRVTFEADGPHGVMRFEGTNITVEESGITFHPTGLLTALDAIGTIYCYSLFVSDPTDPALPCQSCDVSGGYTFTDATSVESVDDLFLMWPIGIPMEAVHNRPDEPLCIPVTDHQPNFIRIVSGNMNTASYTLSSIMVYYRDDSFHTGLRSATLATDFYGMYLPGEKYPIEKEVYDSANSIYDFYLQLQPELKYEIEPYTASYSDLLTLMSRSLIDIYPDRYTLGDLKSPSGEVLDRTNARLEVGSTLDITVGNYTLPILLPVFPPFEGGRTMHDLVPHAFPEANGTLDVLVIPVAWQDAPQEANAENLANLQAHLGRVEDGTGVITDHSSALTDEAQFSLSEYFDLASYGKLNIQSHITDWFVAPYNFSEVRDQNAQSNNFLNDLYDWIYASDPDMDWSRFDRDANGYFDAVIFATFGEAASDGVVINSFSGAVHFRASYTPPAEPDPTRPLFNNYITIHKDMLSHALVHEFGHTLGLIDYYDVSYSGADAVGGFDMQSGSYGDWNAYSKYAMNWIDPEIVTGLASGESVELTIGSFAQTGDAIAIPAAGTQMDSPFGEYLLIDLFTDELLNEHDAAGYGLGNTAGVRIYHVNAAMELHEETANGTVYPIGTIHVANDYKKSGKYNIELIQAGAKNTFTDLNNLRTNLSAADLFEEGDTFTMEKYHEFFVDGLFDDGSEFGYTIQIVSLSRDAATIRITRN